MQETFMTHAEQKPQEPTAIYLKDYTPPEYRIDTVELKFDLGDETTRLHARLQMAGQYDRAQGERPLVLQGHDVELVSVVLDGRTLVAGDYQLNPDSLVIHRGPAALIPEVAP